MFNKKGMLFRVPCTFVRKLSNYLFDNNSLMFEFLEPTAINRLLEEHRTRKCDNHKLLFSLIVFEEWLRSNQSVNYQKAEQS